MRDISLRHFQKPKEISKLDLQDEKGYEIISECHDT